jgi:L-threonylcarbamoyladenylate synthase
MTTPAIRPWQIKQAALAVDSGGIIAYPTEAVYGLGCNPDNSEAVLRLLTLKQRPWEKGVILIASCIEQLEPYAQLNAALLKRITPTWPGPVTWILPAREDIPPLLHKESQGEANTIAVRVTAHPIAAAICDEVGHALVSTSTHVSNHLPARTPFQVRNIFHNEIDYIVHGATGNIKKPTEIRDAKTNRIIRSG